MSDPPEVKWSSHSSNQDLLAVFHKHLKDAAQKLARKRFKTREKRATQEISADDINRLRKIFEKCFKEGLDFEEVFVKEFGGSS